MRFAIYIYLLFNIIFYNLTVIHLSNGSFHFTSNHLRSQGGGGQSLPLGLWQINIFFFNEKLNWGRNGRLIIAS